MLLKRIELVGFKSFVGRTILEIREGITAIVGPNGCGKSNIVDAIRWVFGEQSPRSLRISQQSELLFNGSKAHTPVNFSEVSVIFDNSDNALPVDISEVAITRRLYRNGEGGYYLNDRPVHLKEIRTLFSSLGIGFSPYSILEQGRTDQLLTTKPEVRREIFEEAAGIRGYRVKFAESNRKLAKVEQQMEALRPMFQEVERTYHTRKEQWKQLERYRELAENQKRLSMQRAGIEYQQLDEQRKRHGERLDQAQKKYREATDRETQYRHDARAFQQQVSEIYNAQERNREEAHEKRLRIERERGVIEGQRARINQLERSITEQSQRISNSFAQIESMTTQQKQLEENLEEGKQLYASLQNEQRISQQEQQTLRTRRAACAKERKKCEEVIAAHEKEQQQLREQMTILSEKIVEQIDQLLSDYPSISASTIIDDPQLDELAQKNQHLIARIGTILNDYRVMETSSLSTLQQIIEQIITTQDALQENHQQYTRMRSQQLQTLAPLFTLLTDPKNDFATHHQIDQKYTAIQAEIVQRKNEMERIASEQLEIEQRLHRLADRVQEEAVKCERQRMYIENTSDKRTQLVQQIEAHTDESKSVHDRISAYRDQQAEIEKAINITEQQIQAEDAELAESKKQDHAFSAQLDKVRKSIDNIDRQSEKNREQSQRLRAQLDNVLNIQGKAAAKRELAIKQFRDQFGVDLVTYSSALPSAPSADHDSLAKLTNKINDLTTRIEQLGKINMMAQDDFNEAESRYAIMNKHYQDLIEAQRNLAEVTKTINLQSSERLQETVAAIDRHFREICTYLFTESNGSVSLAEPEKPLESDVLIMIQPQGKKNEKIEHLSGGERVMASLALLFALYRQNPSSVAFLDEVDAALDEDNVVRVANYIREHLQSTQSVIITHNRQTVSVAHNIIGVTMEQYGISKVLEIAVQDYL